MPSDHNDNASAAANASSLQEDGSPGSYSLRELIQHVPLSTNDHGVRAHITCVEAWNGNLYIGTSDAKVLHYVSIPSDDDAAGLPVYIFATEITPDFSTQQTGPDAGVKQILVLPNAAKACIVCNSTLTFYTLPELSPAFDGRIRQAGCSWVGGLDRDDTGAESGSPNGTVVVICLRQRLRLIRIGDEARKIRDIELAGVGTLERRGDLACVADGNAYSLLDVVNQRKNELFPISSLSAPSPPASRHQELAPPPTQGRPISRSFSSRSPVRQGRAHQRITSLGGQAQNTDRLRPDTGSPLPARASSRLSTESPAPEGREASPEKQDEVDVSKSATEERPKSPEKKDPPLQPNILTPTSNEFLLTTGTKRSDPGVSMFVNLEGDVVRGTLEFSSYPDAMLLDGSSTVPGMPDAPSAEGYVLALVRREVDGKQQRCIEFQRWDADPGEAHRTREWLALEAIGPEIDSNEPAEGTGLRNATTTAELPVNEVSVSLRLRRLQINGAEEGEEEAKRNQEEDKLAARFAHVRANVLLYSGDCISWIVKEPMITQLDKQLSAAMQNHESGALAIDVPTVQRVVNGVRGQEPRDELEFLTLTHVRQKAALLLFGNLVLQTASGVIAYEHDKRRAEDALTAGEIDPRIVLTLVPGLEAEIAQGSGIWLPQGLRDTIDWLRSGLELSKLDRDSNGAYGDNLLSLTKRYMMTWRKKKGFGSVVDEVNVFRSVDAALLQILLMLDQNSPRGPATPGSIRAELNEVVDKGVDCFDRAVELCEQYNRLFVLSRLYQNRRNVPQVLATWKRILDGEKDAGGEMIEGEQDMRRYLSKIRDTQLVQEYGAWLAQKNPKLGVQIFADDNSRVQFDPQEAVRILKERAPEAVKDYLEHLVFGKNHTQYVNDLIAFYLDTVLTELSTSKHSRDTLLQSYETYRALHAPKPTYRQFILDNAIDADWFHNRMRLLELIGGSRGAASEYNVHTLGQRLAPYSNELVPEMIILNGREGNHEAAIQLLTHGLGDYDTAIRYCLLGGSSIFHPSSTLGPEQPLPSKAEQSRLFTCLLHEFFKISDLNERLERTAELLERFGAWFDIVEVLGLVPEDWSVELVSGFLVHAFRRLVAEKNETVIVKALCSAQNLAQSVRNVEEMEKAGPVIVRTEGEEQREMDVK